MNDLARQGTKEFPYLWKPEKSEEILEFAETLTIAEGMSPKPVQLFDNQCFDLGVPMGWVKQNGYRRFRRSYESMARQNGKSFKNGIRGPYIALASGYHYGKLFTAATKKRQARIAWEEMMKFIRSDPELAELFKIQEYKSLITCYDTNCTIEALSKEGGLDDGFRGIFNSVDEVLSTINRVKSVKAKSKIDFLEIFIYNSHRGENLWLLIAEFIGLETL